MSKFKQKIYKRIWNIEDELKHLNHSLRRLLNEEYSVPEVAIELRLSKGSIYKIDPLKLPYFKRGKFRVYRKEDVLKYKKELENKHA